MCTSSAKILNFKFSEKNFSSAVCRPYIAFFSNTHTPEQTLHQCWRISRAIEDNSLRLIYFQQLVSFREVKMYLQKC